MSWHTKGTYLIQTYLDDNGTWWAETFYPVNLRQAGKTESEAVKMVYEYAIKEIQVIEHMRFANDPISDK